MQDKAVVVQPDEGRSFWQPVPANGYVEIKFAPSRAAVIALTAVCKASLSAGLCASTPIVITTN